MNLSNQRWLVAAYPILLALGLAACSTQIDTASPHDGGSPADSDPPCAALDEAVDWSPCADDVRTGYARSCWEAMETPSCADVASAAYGCLAKEHRTCSETDFDGGSVASLSGSDCGGQFPALDPCINHCSAPYSCDNGVCQCDPGAANPGAACSGYPDAGSSLPVCPSLCAVCAK